jgi:hypothetical protein
MAHLGSPSCRQNARTPETCGGNEAFVLQEMDTCLPHCETKKRHPGSRDAVLMNL